MLSATNINVGFETDRQLSSFTDNLTAFLGLLVLGFPLTSATIRTAVGSWALVTIASVQFVLQALQATDVRDLSDDD